MFLPSFLTSIEWLKAWLFQRSLPWPLTVAHAVYGWGYPCQLSGYRWCYQSAWGRPVPYGKNPKLRHYINTRCSSTVLAAELRVIAKHPPSSTAHRKPRNVTQSGDVVWRMEDRNYAYDPVGQTGAPVNQQAYRMEAGQLWRQYVIAGIGMYLKKIF